jgi:hypothetical protein
LASLITAIVIGVVAFFLAFLGFSALFEPIMPGKPWPSMEWDNTMVVRILAALIVAVLAAVYVYKYMEYSPTEHEGGGSDSVIVLPS